MLRLDDLSVDITSPVMKDEVSFPQLSPKDIRIIDEASKTVLLVLHQELRIYSYAGDVLTNLTYDGSVVPPKEGIAFEPSAFPPSCGTFAQMVSAEVHRIHDGTEERTLAFVETVMNHPNLTKPRAKGIVVCDITDPATAAFLTGPGQQLDPVPAASCPPPAGLGLQWAIEDFVILQDGAQHLLYAAGGVNVGIRRVEVTNILTSGFGTPSLLTSGPFFGIAADKSLPVAGADYLYAVRQDAIYAIDRQNPSLIGFTLTDTGNEAIERDMLLMLEGDDRRKLWSVIREQADFKWKITDVTQPLPPALPVDPGPIEGRYACGGVDGAVYVSAWDRVFALNFGGVIPWDLTGTEPQPVYDAYQPAADAAGTYVTE